MDAIRILVLLQNSRLWLPVYFFARTSVHLWLELGFVELLAKDTLLMVCPRKEPNSLRLLSD